MHPRRRFNSIANHPEYTPSLSRTRARTPLGNLRTTEMWNATVREDCPEEGLVNGLQYCLYCFVSATCDVSPKYCERWDKPFVVCRGRRRVFGSQDLTYQRVQDLHYHIPSSSKGWSEPSRSFVFCIPGAMCVFLLCVALSWLYHCFYGADRV